MLSRLAIAVVAFFLAMEAPAQVARVFLSGTGDDANDCSNAATPCRSLQGAVNQSPMVNNCEFRNNERRILMSASER